MDLLTVLTQCSVPSDFTVLLALTLSFSGGQPYTVRTLEELTAGDVADEESLNTETQVQRERAMTRPQAVAKLQSLLAEPVAGEPADGVVVGLLPVPPAWAAVYQQPTAALLDPCTNVSIASAQLSEFEFECRRERPELRRQCAIEHYAKAIGEPIFADDIFDFIDRQGFTTSPTAPVDVTTEAMLASTVFAEPKPELGHGGTRDWGADKLFVPGPPTPESSAASPAATAKANKRPETKQTAPASPKKATGVK